MRTPLNPEERFQDNTNGVISDLEDNREWLPKDSKQDTGKWLGWQEVARYVNLMCQVYAGGYSDWRMPTREEALSLYHPDLVHKDFEGMDVHIHSCFVFGSSYYIWTSEVNDEDQALRVNFRDGTAEFVDKSSQEFHAVRLVRDK